MISTPTDGLFASFSITTGPNRYPLSGESPGICPQVLLAFGRVSKKIAKVSFRLSISTPPDHQYPYWWPFLLVLHNRWAKSLPTFRGESWYMPASSIKVWTCFDKNCKSSFLASPWSGGVLMISTPTDGLFASFSTTTGPNRYPLSGQVAGICPQVLLAFGGVWPASSWERVSTHGYFFQSSFFSNFFARPSHFWNSSWMANFVYYKSGGCSIQSSQQRTFLLPAILQTPSGVFRYVWDADQYLLSNDISW